MFKQKIILSFLIFIFINFNINAQDFLTTEQGTKYKVLDRKEGSKKAKEGGFAKYHLKIEAGEKVWQNTFDIPNGEKLDLVRKQQNILDMTGVFSYVSEGDSILALQNLDSLRKRQQLPPDLAKVKEAKYTFKIVKLFDNEDDIKKYEEEAIAKYAKSHNLTLKKHESGLYYAITKENPDGQKAKKGDFVNVHYVGKLLNDSLFDTSREEEAKKAGSYNPNRDYNTGFTFKLDVGSVIRGWDIGFQLLRKGEKATLLIPSYLGYGASGSGKITPYSTLVFDVELLNLGETKEGAESKVKATTDNSSSSILIKLAIGIPVVLLLVFLFMKFFKRK